MKFSNLPRIAALSAVIGLAGFGTAQLLLPKVQQGLPDSRQLAVVALAAVADARVAHPEVPAGLNESAPGMPDPVALGPAVADADPADAVAEAAEPAPAAVTFEEADFLAGIQQGVIEARLRGNGRERMTATLRNNSPAPLRVTIHGGQVLEGGRNRVVVIRSVSAELMPARSVDLQLATAALHSSNTVADGQYKISYKRVERIDGFLVWAGACQEISTAAIQTAILALTENLPLSAFARFTPLSEKTSLHNTDAFRVDTADILAALTALRESGTKLETLALSLDPQLRIESMIEPLSREAAKRYYGITEEREWDFWKHELLQGNPSTRHYALFGIARFYPDVALEMLPKWARETQTHPVYRTAAVQALADTQRAEALPLLRQIAVEVGPQTELGKAATQAATFLDRRLSEVATRSQVVAFRDRTRVEGL